LPFHYVDVPLTADPQVPGGDLVGARAGATKLWLRFLDHLQRHLPHVLLEAPPAHVARGTAILGDGELRPLVAVGGSAHAYDRRERRALSRGSGIGQKIEDLLGLKPLLHGSVGRLYGSTDRRIAPPTPRATQRSRTAEKPRHKGPPPTTPASRAPLRPARQPDPP